MALLGLVKLIEMRGWAWQASDGEIDATLKRLGWDGSLGRLPVSDH